MLPALILILAALAAALLRLLAYRGQMLEMARILEETPAASNLRLTVRMSGAAPRRLCRAINARLEAGRQLRMETIREERELKYAMAAISHDIRTPLTGALGYLQLMEDAPEGREAYLPIVRRRLEQLEELLGELFLYTRLLNDPAPMECGPTAALPLLWEALAELCPQLEAAGVTPELPSGDLSVWASAPALGRVYRNLIVNALRHGGGGLAISAGEGEIRFSNPLGPGPAPDPARLFDRFYQSSPRPRSGWGWTGPVDCPGADGADGGPGLRPDRGGEAGDLPDLLPRPGQGYVAPVSHRRQGQRGFLPSRRWRAFFAS